MMSPVFQAGKLPSSYDLVQFRYQCFGAILLVYPQAVHAMLIRILDPFFVRCLFCIPYLVFVVMLTLHPSVDSLDLLRSIMFASWSSLSLS